MEPVRYPTEKEGAGEESTSRALASQGQGRGLKTSIIKIPEEGEEGD